MDTLTIAGRSFRSRLMLGTGKYRSPNLQILREQVTSVPLIVDAGVGTASDAAVAMELGMTLCS